MAKAVRGMNKGNKGTVKGGNTTMKKKNTKVVDMEVADELMDDDLLEDEDELEEDDEEELEDDELEDEDELEDDEEEELEDEEDEDELEDDDEEDEDELEEDDEEELEDDEEEELEDEEDEDELEDDEEEELEDEDELEDDDEEEEVKPVKKSSKIQAKKKVVEEDDEDELEDEEEVKPVKKSSKAKVVKAKKKVVEEDDEDELEDEEVKPAKKAVKTKEPKKKVEKKELVVDTSIYDAMLQTIKKEKVDPYNKIMKDRAAGKTKALPPLKRVSRETFSKLVAAKFNQNNSAFKKAVAAVSGTETFEIKQSLSMARSVELIESLFDVIYDLLSIESGIDVLKKDDVVFSIQGKMEAESVMDLSHIGKGAVKIGEHLKVESKSTTPTKLKTKGVIKKGKFIATKK